MVESSIFGSYFVALDIAREMIYDRWYKLRYFILPVDGALDVFCLNKVIY